MSNFVDRLADVRTGALWSALKLVGRNTGTWDKFLFGGGAGSPTTKPGDYDIYDREAIAKLFDRQAEGAKYMASVVSDAEGSAKEVVKSKLKSDMLASMEQAIGLRYSSRMRHMTASASRLRSISGTDAETLKLRAENV